ncbi:hypothetical protein AVEN_248930-1, partial [Araneus ventricosus]
MKNISGVLGATVYNIRDGTYILQEESWCDRWWPLGIRPQYSSYCNSECLGRTDVTLL